MAKDNTERLFMSLIGRPREDALTQAVGKLADGKVKEQKTDGKLRIVKQVFKLTEQNIAMIQGIESLSSNPSADTVAMLALRKSALEALSKSI